MTCFTKSTIFIVMYSPSRPFGEGLPRSLAADDKTTILSSRCFDAQGCDLYVRHARMHSAQPFLVGDCLD